MKFIYSITLIISIFLISCNKTPHIIDPSDDSDTATWTRCPGLDSIQFEGRVYHTVLIGDQCWLQENMNLGSLINNNESPNNNGIIEKYCYNNDTNYCNKYGGLYTWREAMKYTNEEYSQGICPQGFHIPTDEEFKILEGTVDSQFNVGDAEWNKLNTWRGYDAGGHLKATGTTDWNAPNAGATNSSGFSALPHGYLTFDNHNFASFTGYMCIWTSSKFDEWTAYRRAIGDQSKDMHRSHHNIFYGYSVRCIRN